MNYKQMNAFLREVYGTHKKGGDEKIVIDDYERKYRYVYIYNDFCVKSILTGDGKDLSLVTDLVNATLGLRGADCISNARLENPTLPGGLYKDIEHDILLGIPPRDMNIAGVQPLVNHENFQKDCRDCLKGVHHRPVNSAEQSGNGVARPWDRIAVEIQNVGYDSFNKRLMFYVARNVSNSLMKGEFYDKIPRTNVICFQMFDYLPWKRSRRYVHTIRYFDDECNLFSDYQTVTIVEVRKFLKHAKTDYAQDQCRLAQWLCAIDALNNNGDFTPFESDAHFRLLQSRAKLSNFMPEAFVTAGESMDKHVEERLYIACQKERKRTEKLMATIAENMQFIAEKDRSIAEKLQSIAEKDAALSAKDIEIARLMSEIEILRSQIAR